MKTSKQQLKQDIEALDQKISALKLKLEAEKENVAPPNHRNVRPLLPNVPEELLDVNYIPTRLKQETTKVLHNKNIAKTANVKMDGREERPCAWRNPAIKEELRMNAANVQQQLNNASDSDDELEFGPLENII